MPTYQYACTHCDHRFEQVQAFSDASLTECPVCGSTLRKVYGSVGVVFKGSGFYRTDSRTAAAGSAGGEKSDAGSGDNGKAAAKESTPAKSADSSAGSGSSGSGSSGSGSDGSGASKSGSGSAGSSGSGAGAAGSGKASTAKPAAAAKSGGS